MLNAVSYYHSFTENNITVVLKKLGFGINFVEPCLRKVPYTGDQQWEVKTGM